jgi:hypothetical protein
MGMIQVWPAFPRQILKLCRRADRLISILFSDGTMMASQKLPNCCVALHPSSLRRTVCTPHSSGFARLAFGAFCLAIADGKFLYEYQP